MDQTVRVHVDAIYQAGKLGREVHFASFNDQVISLYKAVKGNLPENIILKYTDKDGKEVEVTMKEAGERHTERSLRATAATAACIFLRKNDVDGATMRKLYCLEDEIPSAILANRGKIFAGDKILCMRTPDLIKELMI